MSRHQNSLAGNKKGSVRKEAAVSRSLAFVSYRRQNHTPMFCCKCGELESEVCLQPEPCHHDMSTLGGPPHPVIVIVMENKDYIKGLLSSYCATITGWGVLLISTRQTWNLSWHTWHDVAPAKPKA